MVRSTGARQPDSTAIDKAEYYYASGRGYLIVCLKRNPSKGYVYEGVPQALWGEFVDAPSKGRFYNARIRGRYGFSLRE